MCEARAAKAVVVRKSLGPKGLCRFKSGRPHQPVAVYCHARHAEGAVAPGSGSVVQQAQKPGQPVPLSNLVLGAKRPASQPAQAKSWGSGRSFAVFPGGSGHPVRIGGIIAAPIRNGHHEAAAPPDLALGVMCCCAHDCLQLWIEHPERFDEIDRSRDTLRVIKLHGNVEAPSELGTTVTRVTTPLFAKQPDGPVMRAFEGSGTSSPLVLRYSFSDRFDISSVICRCGKKRTPGYNCRRTA
jgi:hypothetical protein